MPSRALVDVMTRAVVARMPIPAVHSTRIAPAAAKDLRPPA
jgi:hypothetical protein